MKVKELQKAIHDKSPIEVYLKDIDKWVEYERVINIMYSEFDGEPIISATVLDKCGHSQTVARAGNIRLKEENK